jgi:signal transduction histidine kinase
MIGTATGLVCVAALNPHLPGLDLSLTSLLAAAFGILVSIGIWECMLERTLSRRRVLFVGSADLAEIAAAAIHEIEPVAAGHELSQSGDESVPVTGNPDELHRLVVNLIDNSLIHTPPGTPVRVRVGREGDDAVLVVEDDGPGIPEELREQVFGRFVRGSGPADRAASGGTGLGLAIVRSVAGAHGGSVEAGPAASGGARFVVRMPLGERAAEREAARV